MDNLPAEFRDQMADLNSHHIEGVAVMGNAPFDVPIVSHVEGNLWQGGCPAPRLPAYFRFVLNLYPWQSYERAGWTEMRTERLYDRGEIPDAALLETLADWVNEKRDLGPTLVHCQAGLNRSALVTALAMIRRGCLPETAIATLRERRSPAVLCNSIFEKWLLGYRM